MPNKERRTRADEQLILLLASGKSQRAAAFEAKVSEATVGRRLRDPAFQERLRAARNEYFQAALGKLSSFLDSAAVTLALLLSEETPGAVRLGAARAILDFASVYRQQQALTEEVAALRQALTALQAQGQRGDT